MYDRLTIREPCMKRLGNARHHLSVGRRKLFFFTGVEILYITSQQLFRTMFCWRFVTSDNFSFQVFSYTADKEIRTDDLCLDVSRLNGPVTMLKCHHMRGNQLWEYDAEVPGLWGWGWLRFSQENSVCPCAPGISRSRAKYHCCLTGVHIFPQHFSSEGWEGQTTHSFRKLLSSSCHCYASYKIKETFFFF